MAGKLKGTSIRSGSLTTTQLNNSLTETISSGGGPKIKSLTYVGSNTAANTGGGETLYLTGSGFNSNFSLYINGNTVSTTTFNSSSNISFTTPALSACTYPIYLVNNNDGAMAILVPGIQYSNTPVWTTAATLNEISGSDVAWDIQLAATSDSNITYSLDAGSSLPPGITLAANGALTGTLSSPSAEDTTYNFTVVATDVENQTQSRAFSVTVTVTDPQFYLTTLLLHGDGTNNQTNHSFIDSSNNAYSLTRGGNATQGTFSPFSPVGWSNYFDGTGDYLTVPATDQFAFGTGAWTVEFWVYPLAYGSSVAGGQLFGTVNGASSGYSINLGTSNSTFRIISNATGTWADNLQVSSGGGPTLNTWSHMAIVRNGANLSIYKDGTRVANTSSATSWNFTGSIGVIGRFNDGSITREFNGYLSNLRVVKGSAVYDPTQSSITVPTAALTAVSNTQLLTCQNNRFLDNSTNAFTITRVGDTAIQPFSPLRPTAFYSTANVGGSVYLDGNGDFVEVSNTMSLGTSEFTIEFWMYPLTQYADGNDIVILSGEAASQGATGWGVALGSYNGYNGLLLVSGTYGQGTGGDYVNNYWGRKNCWDHIVWQRRNSVLECYINGVSQSLSSYSEGTGSTSDTKDFSGSNTTKRLGTDLGGGGAFHGYISGFRIVSGNAVYSGNFTPPTSPPTNIANTKWLMTFTNAGVIDSTSRNIIETVGDAKLSTSVKKYGTASMHFDGSGDRLAIPASQSLTFGTNDFTIEYWMYPISNGTGNRMMGNGTSPYSANDWSVWPYNASGKLALDVYNINATAPALISTTTMSPNNWYHVAIVRSGTSFLLFINGTQEASTTSSVSFDGGVATPIYIGDAGFGEYYNGYIDDLRITKGYARYTSNFTAPTAAFKDK
jgi:hypothetical protein